MAILHVFNINLGFHKWHSNTHTHILCSLKNNSSYNTYYSLSSAHVDLCNAIGTFYGLKYFSFIFWKFNIQNAESEREYVIHTLKIIGKRKPTTISSISKQKCIKSRCLLFCLFFPFIYSKPKWNWDWTINFSINLFQWK